MFVKVKSVVSLSLALALALAISFTFASPASAAAPPNWNFVRVDGTVFTTYSSGTFSALEILLPNFDVIRIECNNTPGLGCQSFVTGDRITAYAHLHGRISCHTDGVDAAVDANLLYKCNAQGTGCVLVTSTF